MIDFTAARVHDVRWWRRANVLIKAMAAEDDITAVRAAFDLQRSLAGNSGLTDKSFEGVQKKANALFGDMIEVLYPWASKDNEAKKQTQIGNMIADYKRLVGDPDDPEYAKKLLHDLEMQDKQAEEETPESDGDRIDRLLKERDAHYDRIRNGTAKQGG